MGMTYCLLEETSTFSFVLAPENEDRQQRGGWGLGFRVGAGLDIEPLCVDIAGYWTRFHHTMHSATQTDHFILGTQVFFGGDFALGGGALAGILGTPGGPAFSRWQIHLDLAEIDFGYWIRSSRWFSLRPYLGLEGGWINQKQIVQYNQFLATGSNVFFDATITQINNFKGVGPVLGLDGLFSVGCGFGLLGKLAACFLYGRSHNPASLHIDSGATPPPLFDTSILYEQHRLMPALRSQVGFNWEKRLAKYCSLFLNAAYEVQYFWETWRNQNSFIQSIALTDAGYGDLMLHGFTGQVRVSF